MTIIHILLMLSIGVGGGFIAGLVGIGGSIIIYPAILLLPPLFGTPEYSAYIASGLTSSQVFFSTLSGSIRAVKEPDFNPPLVLYMGGGMLGGSVAGAMVANLVTTPVINAVYIGVAILALILMFIKVKPHDDATHSYNHWLLIAVGAVIGLVAGIIGAGGAFIVIPVLLAIFKLPMNTVVTNSIVIACMSAIGSFTIKLMQGYVPLGNAIFLIIGSVIFAPIGLKVGRLLPNIIQKAIISILIVIAITELIF
ncbi:sulfite exporter TauE/SafE family protein [Staphylococcus condimenti]|uniref:Probable membrane transporter protein n=1 Tax=Staphylococcus condimenti TaxID=70255 RepID=A0AB37H4Y3_9STAP|nr:MULTISPECIES: sulfite exporter TauE/SafE family protein [Staphylococcus]AMY05959.1 hypothetical protein A4G25_08475 [Staphylococcus condimenti]APR59822.1 hypothetical protein BTZ13_00755 [Staphylococcus condimenti]MDK8644950.1 sulfite exporter TauE/SafE family protein [Staphylococcus condimenti]OFP03006.1 hypothetical protein HMPREF3007_08285 [Staphylococcus sp. HMSC065E08]PNZ60585.1 sulfite exporter TauE/SafE family protein [Staphylococcus condimenti]